MDDQRKRDEEAAEKYALAQQPGFDPSIYSESHEFKAKLRVYFELKWAYYAALKRCRDTEVKELRELCDKMSLNSLKIEIERDEFREQLRVAVLALEDYSHRVASGATARVALQKIEAMKGGENDRKNQI